jgi:ApbE superfamily uncharacterized protein (UPF0280 family)
VPYQRSITLLDGGAVMAECGPMRITIFASVDSVPQRDMAVQAARESFGCLERVARLRDVLGRRWTEVPTDITDSVALTMVRSVLAVGDEDLTPMAAVAGTIGDTVADFLSSRGMTKVVVDNGGDVAVRLRGKARARVGIRPEVGNGEISHVLVLDSRYPSWGIATSGFGGRSLTRGIASAATVIAMSASVADAAATAVANASLVEDENVIQGPAERMDPDTDIGGLNVTWNVGPLGDDTKTLAVCKALHRADELSQKGLVLGAFVAVGNKVGMTGLMKDREDRVVESIG